MAARTRKRKAKTETTATTTEEQGAVGHFRQAEEALEEGNLTGAEGVTDHLEEALTVAEGTAKEEAEEGIEAAEKGDREAVKEHVEEGLEAAEQTQEPVSPASGTVEVSLGEWFVKPDKRSIKAGAIEFTVTNDGRVVHEFVVIKTDRAPGKLPVEGGKVDDEKAGEELGEIEEFDPGKTETMKLKLEPGKYVLICSLPGHYRNGQYVGFTVT